MKKFSQYVTEVSTGKLVDYVAKASQDVGRRIEKAEPGVKPFKKILDRSGKIGRAKAHIKMKTDESSDMCNVCGQTPCNCTSIDEQSLDEISIGTLERYRSAAKSHISKLEKDFDAGDRSQKRATDIKKRDVGVSKAFHKIQKAKRDAAVKANPPKPHSGKVMSTSDAIAQDYKDQEARRGIGHVRDSVELDDSNPINEISKQLKDRYVARAVTAHSGYNMARRNTQGDEKEYFARKEKNTQKGISRAVGEKSLTKEESENVNELRVSTLLRYNTKAHASSRKLGGEAARAMDNGDTESWAKNANKRDNRDKGILRSALKLRNKTTKQG